MPISYMLEYETHQVAHSEDSLKCFGSINGNSLRMALSQYPAANTREAKVVKHAMEDYR